MKCSSLVCRLLLLFAISPIAGTLLTSCKKNEVEVIKEPEVEVIKEPEAPKLSQVFQTQILKFLETGSKLNAATSEGLSYGAYSDMLNDVNGTFELSNTIWPEKFAPQAKESFREALASWNFAKELWTTKMQYPDLAGAYDIVNDSYPSMSDNFKALVLVKRDYDNDKHISYSEIPTCLTYSSACFEVGRKNLLSLLK